MSPSKRFRVRSLVASLALASLLNVPCVQATGLAKNTDDIYWFAQDGNRYLFPGQDEALKSWSFDPSAVRSVALDELATHPFAGIVRFRPGDKPAYVQTISQPFAVARHGVLRPFANAAVARAVYPNMTASTTPRIAIAQFTNYTLGDPITVASDFDPKKEAEGIVTPSDNPPLVIQFSAATQKTLQGTITLTVDRDASGAPVARAQIMDANSPPQSLTVELVNQSNIPIRTCAASAHCDQALIGDFATNVTAVIAKVTNELGQVLVSDPVPLPIR